MDRQLKSKIDSQRLAVLQASPCSMEQQTLKEDATNVNLLILVAIRLLLDTLYRQEVETIKTYQQINAVK